LNVLVVPTNRPDGLATFLDAWSPWSWDRIIVVEDGPKRTIKLLPDLFSGSPAPVDVFSWREIDRALPDASIISRGDSAIRCFGFWRAWADGADVIFTLDDDCFPAKGHTARTYLDRHLDNLFRTPMWDSTVPGLRVRGLPYRNLGTLGDVAVSVGLWTGSPDIDSVQSLAASGGYASGVDDTVGTRVMAPDQYFPMSGMNLAFRRDAACLMYFPPMGLNQPYGRFDDIWCGLVVQRICRHLRLPIVCGQPVVDHQRASDPFANLVKEAPGIGANEHMWELIDGLHLTAATPLGCMQELGRQLSAPAVDDPYVAHWGQAIISWCELFRPGG
jgi:hypothetical protein